MITGTAADLADAERYTESAAPLYFTAWLDAAGAPVVEDPRGFESLKEAIDDAVAWQAECSERIVVVRGTGVVWGIGEAAE